MLTGLLARQRKGSYALWNWEVHLALKIYILVLKLLMFILTLRTHAYSNILKMSPPKTENFQIKILIFFIFLLQNIFFLFLLKNIDCGYSLEPPCRGGSREYPQSMFFSRYKKNNVYFCKPQFYYVKVGFKGVTIYRYVFRDEQKNKSIDLSYNSKQNYKCNYVAKKVL